MGRARRERGSSSRLRRTSPNGLLISVEKSLPLNNVFTLAIFIHWGGGDEEMYIVETLAKNRRLYPREGKGCKTIGGNGRDRRRASRSADVGKRQASAISGAKRLIRCWKRTGAGCLAHWKQTGKRLCPTNGRPASC